MKKCRKCGNDLWKIEARESCGDCPENVDKMVQNDGECRLGMASGLGCWFLICSNCGSIDNIPTVEW